MAEGRIVSKFRIVSEFQIVSGLLILVVLASAVPARGQPRPRRGSLTSFGCPLTLEAQRGPTSSIMGPDFVELQRGRCTDQFPDRRPAYTVRLFGNGVVEWHGDRNVEIKGRALGQIEVAPASELIDHFRQQGFWSLCAGYGEAPSAASANVRSGRSTQPSELSPDVPSYTNMVEIAVVSRKTVVDYGLFAPEWLRNFDDDLERLVDTHRWRHGNPATETLSLERLREDLTQPKPGVTELMRAVVGPDPDAMATLLRDGAMVDAEDSSGWTALMYAAGVGKLKTLQQLLAAGADPNHRTRAGESPLFSAVFGILDNDARAKIKLLREAGADINAVSASGETALMVAARHGWQRLQMKTLMELGADAKMKNPDGKTADDLLAESPPLPVCADGKPSVYCLPPAPVPLPNPSRKPYSPSGAQHPQ